MEWPLYLVARALVAFLQSLPLTWVARLGRAGGALACLLDRRHRRVALRNLEMCFGKEKSAAEIRALARENFQRIGESFACAVKTASMTDEELRPHLECVADASLTSPPTDRPMQVQVVAVGHFGNFELYARLPSLSPPWKLATTYRGLRQPLLNGLLLSLRRNSGCQYFERRTETAELRQALNRPGLIVGLLADQHAGKGGLLAPFFGHECSTTAAPAVLAARYHCALRVAICYRVALAKWRIEFGPEIPQRKEGQMRSIEELTREVNEALEAAVRRDPANWFWVHNRWRPEHRAKRVRPMN
jgi:KDO2-lipid IV(A) lauroyltransferase